MKKRMILLMSLALLLAACARTPSQEEDAPVPEAGTVEWESGGFTMTVPADWEDRFLVNPEGDRSGESGILFELCHRETHEAGELYGWVLSVVRGNEEQFRMEQEIGEMRPLATDQEGFYYYLAFPTDVQFSDGEVLTAMTEFRESNELETALEGFVSQNGLSAWEE